MINVETKVQKKEGGAPPSCCKLFLLCITGLHLAIISIIHADMAYHVANRCEPSDMCLSQVRRWHPSRPR